MTKHECRRNDKAQMTKSDTSGFGHSDLFRHWSFGFRHLNHRCFLNSVDVLRKLVTKHSRKIDVVQNDHVSIVLFGVVILPALVPPTKADNCRPAIPEESVQRRLLPA